MDSRLSAVLTVGISVLLSYLVAVTVSSNQNKAAQFTLTASVFTNGIYRLNTATGAILWCHPAGTNPSDYKLVCLPENR